VVRFLIAVLALGVFTLATLTGLGWMALETPRRRAVTDFAAATDSASLARGRVLATAGCSCHGNSEGTLSGSPQPLFDDLPLGTLWAPNLTPGGSLGRYSNGELARAIREGLDANGRPLALMPSRLFREMSDADLAATLGFLRAQPAVAHRVPARHLGPLHYLLVSTRVLPSPVQPRIAGHVSGPMPQPDPGYGRYMSRILRCVECHGDDLEGGRAGRFRAEPGPELVLAAHEGSYQAFARAVREGVGSDGRRLQPHVVPWCFYSLLGDDELRAIYEFIRAS